MSFGVILTINPETGVQGLLQCMHVCMYVCMYVHAEDYYECAPKVTTWGLSVCVQNGTYACQLEEGYT